MKKLSPTAARLLTQAANNPLGIVSVLGKTGWEQRAQRREAEKLVERGLFKPYHQANEYLITDDGRGAYDAMTLA